MSTWLLSKESLPPAYSPTPTPLPTPRPLLQRLLTLLALIITFSSLRLAFSPTSSTAPFGHLRHQVVCPGLQGITGQEFRARQTRLARMLEGERGGEWGVYISEPGPNTLYYTNISSNDWMLSERPFLVVLSPMSNKGGSRVSVLVPGFELSRAKGLGIAGGDTGEKGAGEGGIDWVTWEESDDPYQVLVDHLEVIRAKDGGEKTRIKIGLEENVRTFVGEGLRVALSASKGGDVGLVGLPMRELRMKKTENELRIQRCVAKVTLEAIRTVREMIHVGMTEHEGEKLITDALTVAGLTDLGNIVLYGPNAALPHASASSRRLEAGEFILMDVDGSLLGYQSDLTRTMLPDTTSAWGLLKMDNTWPDERSEKIWKTVRRAQEAALRSLEREEHVEVRAMDVDRAARSVIEAEGWGKYFSHRLGHGIGIQVHEHPYLNSGNPQVLLPGETFSNEPGIYIEALSSSSSIDSTGERGIGVRLEDMVHLTATGWELLTGSGLARDPWNP